MRKLLIVLVALLLVTGSGVRQAYSADDAKPAVHPATANQAAAGKKVKATGTIEPEEVVNVCAQVPGKIVSLGADPCSPDKCIGWDSSVEAGTVLAQIDSQLYSVRVEFEHAACARARAELAQVTINLERAEAQWKQAQELEKSKAIPGSDFDLAKFNYKAAKAAVTVAEAVLGQNRAALKQAEIGLGYTTIKSPIKGVVIDRRVSVGQMVAPTDATGPFLVATADKLDVWASVKEADIPQIHQQQPVRFTVDAFPGRVFEGKVKQIRLNATMAQNVVTYTVVIAMSGTPKDLLPYMTANVEFE